MLVIWHGVRAEAQAMSGNVAAASQELLALRAARDATPQPAPGARTDGNELAVAAIADGVARGRIAEAQGNADAALRHYRAAEAIEANLPYFEPPLWPTPVAVLAGQLHLRLGDRATAAADFQRALVQRPNNSLAAAGLVAAA